LYVCHSFYRAPCVYQVGNGFYWSGETLLELWRQQRDLQQQLQQQQQHATTKLRLQPPGAASQRPPRLAAIGKSVSLSPYGADDDGDMEDDRRSCTGIALGRRISRHHSVDIRDQQNSNRDEGGTGGEEYHPPPPLPLMQQRLLLSSPRLQTVRHHSMDIRPFHHYDGGAEGGGGGGGTRHYSVDVRTGGVGGPELTRRPQSLPDNFRTGIAIS
jgi:hypothetical protein